ncbi:hypothetical protein F2P45_33490 [Massilia sp. CCM 8733]|uniref:Uncharacterized protein n=1 Tax=Massilia mucilaginosa TaxID=2609282 RepID=A0ABX0P3F9_9BURK|nr:hypothetical protein [Massilia mucilaginosa]
MRFFAITSMMSRLEKVYNYFVKKSRAEQSPQGLPSLFCGHFFALQADPSTTGVCWNLAYQFHAGSTDLNSLDIRMSLAHMAYRNETL